MTKSKNMNYYFNKEYFMGLKVSKNEDKIQVSLDDDSFSDRSLADRSLADRSLAVRNFNFIICDGSYRPWDIPGVQKFELTTTYPGLLMGTGYAHDLNADDAVKCGFSFDYVSGLPYLPGSSLKGMLRSYFPRDGQNDNVSKNKKSYIKSLIGRGDDLELKQNIFDNGDVFLDVFPSKNNEGKLLEFEFITPHKDSSDGNGASGENGESGGNYEQFGNPIPIKLIKVKPNVTFRFCFILNDYKNCENEVIVSKDEKMELFRQIILDMGIGAKTNVGFGKMQEKKYPSVCKRCGATVGINSKTGKPYEYCSRCSSRK